MGNIKRRSYCYSEALPFAAMVTVEVANVGLSTLFKAASNQGMSYRVFMLYSYAISAIALAPVAFFFHHRKTPMPSFSISLLGRILLLAILGFSAQMLGYKGIEYSSPTLSSAISNLTPAITFAMALIFRMEKVDVRSPPSVAKILGTIVSIIGALVVVLYKGPVIINTRSASINPARPLTSSQSDWVIGGLLLTIDYILLSGWYIFQAQTVRIYPAEVMIVCFFSIAVTIIATPVCFFTEPDINAWKISTEIMLVAILYAGIVGSSFGTAVHTWGLRVKGPLYVALFHPLSIAIAAIMSVIFLGDSLYLGSVVGAVVISIGFYAVMWGKANEETGEDEKDGNSTCLSSENAPLLHG